MPIATFSAIARRVFAPSVKTGGTLICSITSKGCVVDLTSTYPLCVAGCIGSGVSISTVTAWIVLGVRVSVSVLLSTLPFGMMIAVAPSTEVPLATLIGSIISKGAPLGTTALNRFVPTFSSATTNGNCEAASGFQRRSNCWSSVKPSKIPAGSEVRLL